MRLCVCLCFKPAGRASERQRENECGEISLRRQTKKSQTFCDLCDLSSLVSAKVRYIKIKFLSLLEPRKSAHLFGKGKKNTHCTDKERRTMEASDDDRSSHGLTCHTAPVRFILIYIIDSLFFHVSPFLAPVADGESHTFLFLSLLCVLINRASSSSLRTN